MSDIEIPTGGEAEAISPDEGVAEAEVEQVEAVEEAPQYDYMEVNDEVRGRYVSAKVDGQDVPVKFDELINSYSRESVSTQRFQEAAQVRAEAENAIRLSQAMQANPGLTIQYLAQQAGVSVQEFMGASAQQQQQQIATEAAPAEDEYMDPLEKQLQQQQQMIQGLVNQNEQREADQRLSSAVNHLKGTFQIDDDQARAVVGQAVQMGLGVEALPMIYQSMQYQASQAAQAQHTAGQATENQKRQAAAQQAQQTVASGGGVPTSATTQEVTGNFTSIRDAVLAAVEGAGIA
jgi:hypothetical protein